MKRWVVLGFLFLVSVVTFLDRVNISVAGAEMSRDFGLTDVQFGTIFSAFLLGYALLQIPAGWLGDRFGYQKVLIGTLVFWSVFTVLTPWAGKGFLVPVLGLVPSICLVRFLIGIGEAAAYPCSSALAGRWFAPEQQGLATGVIFAGVGAGSTITPPFVAWLMVNFGWEMSFYVCGVLGVALAGGFVLWVPGSSSVSAASTDHPPVRHRKKEASAVDRETLRKLVADRNVWLLAMSYGATGYVLYVFLAWFFRYLVDERGMEVMTASFYAMFPFMAMAISSPLGGWISDCLVPKIGKMKARRRIAVIGVVSSLPLMILGAVIEQNSVAVAFFALSFGFLTLATGCYWATAIDLVPGHAALVGATMNMGTNLVGMLAPVLTPFIKDRYGWPAAWTVAALFGLAAALLWMLMEDRDSLHNVD
jgi:ACS family glucarate transporter-like MFS transporter